jgi:hypothetical protein
MALACFGVTNRAEASGNCFKKCMHNCVDNLVANGTPKDQATSYCQGPCIFECSF